MKYLRVILVLIVAAAVARCGFTSSNATLSLDPELLHDQLHILMRKGKQPEPYQYDDASEGSITFKDLKDYIRSSIESALKLTNSAISGNVNLLKELAKKIHIPFVRNIQQEYNHKHIARCNEEEKKKKKRKPGGKIVCNNCTGTFNARKLKASLAKMATALREGDAPIMKILPHQGLGNKILISREIYTEISKQKRKASKSKKNGSKYKNKGSKNKKKGSKKIY